tara:strand:+ start:664 stop:1269 length:606 start_codon:yes stop_codon:yes gene_type:complete
MPRRTKTVNQGGQRRTTTMPCGKIIQGQTGRIQGKISVHQKVCPECAETDCSVVWKEKFSATPNLTDLSGANSGNTRHTQDALVTYYDSETKTMMDRIVPKTGGTQDTVRGCWETLGDLDQDDLIPHPSKKKKKRKKKNKTEEKQGGSSGQEEEQAPEEASGQEEEQEVMVIDLDSEEDVAKLIRMLPDGVTLDELLNSLK